MLQQKSAKARCRNNSKLYEAVAYTLSKILEALRKNRATVVAGRHYEGTFCLVMALWASCNIAYMQPRASAAISTGVISLCSFFRFYAEKLKKLCTHIFSDRLGDFCEIFVNVILS